MSARIGPVVLSAAGDSFTQSCRILAIVWVGTTTAADVCEVVERESGTPLWRGQADGTDTYLGINLGPTGMHAPSGFRLASTTAGTLVLVYLREE